MIPTSTPPQDDTAHYKQVLRDLVDMAADMAKLLHGEAQAQALHHQQAASAALSPCPASPTTPTPTLAIAFDHISRTIRRTILLAQKLGEPPKPIQRTNRVAARKFILREVEDVIQRNAKPADRASLDAELLDRLDAPDLEEDIDVRPLDDIIADFCHDLRVAHPYAANWKRRTPQDVETLRARAAAIPPTWTEPPCLPAPLPKRPKRPKPTLEACHDDPAELLALFAKLANTA